MNRGVRTRRAAVLLIASFAVLLILVSAAAAGEVRALDPGLRVLPFTVLETGSGVSTAPNGPGGPYPQIPGVRIDDAGDAVVLTARTGPYPSTGYSMAIEQIALTQEGSWSVVVRVTPPPPGSVTGSAITSAYQRVRIERTLVGESIPQNWSLVNTEGQVLAKSEDPCNGGECYYSGQEPPRAGHIFTAYVLVRSEEARSRYKSIETECTGAIFNKRGTRLLWRLADSLTTLPQGAAVPAVVILSFKIPKRAGRPSFSTVGRRFGWACSGTAVRVDGSVNHGDGGLAPSWTIMP